MHLSLRCSLEKILKHQGQTLGNKQIKPCKLSHAGLYPCRPLGIEIPICSLHPRQSQGVRGIGTEMIWGWSLPECFASSDVHTDIVLNSWKSRLITFQWFNEQVNTAKCQQPVVSYNMYLLIWWYTRIHWC